MDTEGNEEVYHEAKSDNIDESNHSTVDKEYLEYLSNHDKLAVNIDALPILERQKEIFLNAHRKTELQSSYLLDQKRMFTVYEMLENEYYTDSSDNGDNGDSGDNSNDDNDLNRIEVIDTKVGNFNLDKYISLQYNTHKALKYLYTHTIITDEFNFSQEEIEKIMSIEDQLLIYLVLAKAKKE